MFLIFMMPVLVCLLRCFPCMSGIAVTLTATTEPARRHRPEAVAAGAFDRPEMVTVGALCGRDYRHKAFK
jgi:hypothetical protein